MLFRSAKILPEFREMSAREAHSLHAALLNIKPKLFAKMATPLSLASFVHSSSDQIAAPVNDEIVILSIERGSYYGLDDIGSEIWQRLATPIRIDALCDALAAKYDADRPTIERDVFAFLEKLVADGLISVAA